MSTTLRDFGEVLGTIARFLVFLPARPDLKRLAPLYIAVGLVFAWLAGMGRHLDNDRAELWQRLGLGSVAYVFMMALFLWLILLPLRPNNRSFLVVLVFVCMTAPPALLYAVPVKILFPRETAAEWRTAFLVIVSIWRVSLLAVFLKRACGFKVGEAVVMTLFPLVFIVTALAGLNLDHVVFDLMRGVRDQDRSINDSANGVLVLLSFGSILLSPFLLGAYAILILVRHQRSPGANKAAPE